MSLHRSMKRTAALLIALAAVAAGCKDQKVAPAATATDATESASTPVLQPTVTAPPLTDPHQNLDMTPTASVSPSAAAGDDSDTLVVKGVAFTIPDGWIQEQANGMGRVAQFVLPGAAEQASLVITYWGSDGAGPRDLNVKRWLGMVAVADEAVDDAKPQTETVSHNGLERTVVIATGALSGPSMRPGAPTAAPKLDHTLYGVILEGGPEGPVYLKAVGPAETISAQTAAIEAFVKSAHKAG